MTKFNGTLTTNDLTHIAHVRDRWMHIALSTDRCDRPAAEAAVRPAPVATDCHAHGEGTQDAAHKAAEAHTRASGHPTTCGTPNGVRWAMREGEAS